IALVVIAAAWVFWMYTRSPQPRRDHTVRMIVYFAGLLLIASLLMVRHPIFFIFMITAYFHTSLLRPLPLMVLGVGITVHPYRHHHHRLPLAHDIRLGHLRPAHCHSDAHHWLRLGARREISRAERAAEADRGKARSSP